jgi:MFS family permease
VVGLRVLQAVGNGLILATAPALVSGLFPPEERGRALGIMGAIGTLGMLTGALGGGLLVEAFGWQSIFLGRIPFCVVIALLAVVTLRADPVRRDARGFDVPGAVTLFAGLMALVLFASLGGRYGWTNPKLLALLAVGVVSLAVFVRIETRAASPVLDLALVRDRMVSLPVATAFLMNFATFVNLFILPFFVSDVIAGGALALGIVLMLNPAVGTLSSPAGGWLSDRISPAYLCTAALCLMGASLLWTAMLDEGASVLDVSLRVGLMGLGMGAFQAASSTLIMNRVPQEQHGAGASILSLGRSMGTVSSVALMAAFFAWRLAAQGAASSPSEVAGVVSPEYAGAFVAAFRQTYLVAAALMGVGVALSVAYWPRFTSSRV